MSISFEEYRRNEKPMRVSIRDYGLYLNQSLVHFLKEERGDPEELSFEIDPEADRLLIRPAPESEGDYPFAARSFPEERGYGLNIGSETLGMFLIDNTPGLDPSDCPVLIEAEWFEKEEAVVVLLGKAVDGSKATVDGSLPEERDEAEDLGREAAKEGKSEDDNPYDLSDPNEEMLYFAWQDGFEEVDNDSVNRDED